MLSKGDGINECDVDAVDIVSVVGCGEELRGAIVVTCNEESTIGDEGG
jgi:hypothetical protein